MRRLRRARHLQVATERHHGCVRHPTEPAVATCSRCGGGCCQGCLLEIPDRDPLCVSCGMELAGVRRR